jgi:hypothetical protein
MNMQTIKLTGSAEAKAKALKPYLNETVSIHLTDETFSVGTLIELEQFIATMRCEESGDEFLIRYSKMESASVRSRGNWKSNSQNSSSAKTERLQVRCTLEQRVAIEKAADLAGKNISDFVLDATLDFGKATALWCG